MLDEAVENDRQALRLNPRHLNALCNLGLALSAQGKREEAGVYFLAASKLGARPEQVRLRLARALESQGTLGEAIGQYREALKLGPDNAEARTGLDGALRRQMAPSESSR